MSEYIETIGDRIRKIREEKSLTQAAFGKKLFLERSAISLIERNLRTPTERVLQDICREFHVNKQWLTTGKGSMFLSPNDEDLNEQIERIMAGENEFHKSMFRMLANLDDEDLIALERLVKKLAQTKESYK